MANEIKYNLSMSLSNGSLVDSFSPSGLTANQTNQRMVRNVQSVAAGVLGAGAGDAIDLGGVVVPGLATFANLDLINYIDVGVQVAGVFIPFVHLLAGQYSGPLFLGTAAPFAMANTGAVKLFYIIYER